MKAFVDDDIYSLSSKRQWTLFASNGFQKERIERDAGNNIAAYLPFDWIGFVCVYRFCIHEGFKGCVRQYQEEHCNIATLQHLAKSLRQGL